MTCAKKYLDLFPIYSYFVFQSTFMIPHQQASLKTLQEIHSIMDKSARFISLSGWSGIWAGTIALAGSLIAKNWLNRLPAGYQDNNTVAGQFVLLALAVLALAFAGAYYFTWRKAKLQDGNIWSNASKRMLGHMAIPMAAGAIFALHFLYAHLEGYAIPACLTFYGLALINGSKYTLSDIKYLGLCIVGLGCVNLFMPGMGLTFWTIGFGVLHILYGLFMWNKYDKQLSKEGA